MIPTSERTWLREVGGLTLHQDSGEHVALVLRILDVSEDVWCCMIRGYAERWSRQCHDLDTRAQVLGQAYSSCSPYVTALTVGAPKSCPVCRTGMIVSAYARSVRAKNTSLQYGRCGFCGHGLLLSPPAAAPIYQEPRYYARRRPDGSGYEAYEAERVYRESKAARLLDWTRQTSGISSRSLLEVGSGLGFTRKAAQDRGLTTQGVDVNPYAAERARALYGMDTFTGTLAEARQRGAVANDCDLILYQFVLEHLENPEAELREVAHILPPGGLLVLTIPSIDALELNVFGGSYRSFRSDHLHIFSRQSIGMLLRAAGFNIVREKTECSAHLLAGFYSAAELQAIYESGRGPDLYIVAQRSYS